MLHALLTPVSVDGTLPLLLQGGPDSPFGNVLGWIIVFMVIVWPILRGVLEAATKRRREFEQNQRASGGPAVGRPKKRGGLGDLLKDTLESLEQEASGNRRSPPEQAAPKRTIRVKAAPAKPAAAAGTLRKVETKSTAHRDLVGDPFDDSTMGMDLVPDDMMRPVPTEDSLEADYAGSMPSPGGTRAAFVEPPPRELSELDRPEVRQDRDVLGRLERRLSPWQRAIALNEILSPPVAGRPPTERQF